MVEPTSWSMDRQARYHFNHDCIDDCQFHCLHQCKLTDKFQENIKTSYEIFSCSGLVYSLILNFLDIYLNLGLILYWIQDAVWCLRNFVFYFSFAVIEDIRKSRFSQSWQQKLDMFFKYLGWYCQNLLCWSFQYQNRKIYM